MRNQNEKHDSSSSSSKKKKESGSRVQNNNFYEALWKGNLCKIVLQEVT